VEHNQPVEVGSAASRLFFHGNVWQRESIKEGEDTSTEPTKTGLDKLGTPGTTEVPEYVANRKQDYRFLGFYPQLFVVVTLVSVFGYWWMISSYTENIRWLILPVLNLPILVFLGSVYVFHYIYYSGVPLSPPSPNYMPSEEEAKRLALFRWFPELRKRIAWVHLLDTSRSPITSHQVEIPIIREETSTTTVTDPTTITTTTPPPETAAITIYFKREDLNSSLYSGVKPRTLEFLMASCEANHYHRKAKGLVEGDNCFLYAMGAPGSNQSAATFTHANKVKGVIPGMIAAVPQPPSACNFCLFW